MKTRQEDEDGREADNTTSQEAHRIFSTTRLHRRLGARITLNKTNATKLHTALINSALTSGKRVIQLPPQQLQPWPIADQELLVFRRAIPSMCHPRLGTRIGLDVTGHRHYGQQVICSRLFAKREHQQGHLVSSDISPSLPC